MSLPHSQSRWKTEFESPPFPGDNRTPLQSATNLVAAGEEFTPNVFLLLVGQGVSPADIGQWAHEYGVPNFEFSARESGVTGWEAALDCFAVEPADEPTGAVMTTLSREQRAKFFQSQPEHVGGAFVDRMVMPGSKLLIDRNHVQAAAKAFDSLSLPLSVLVEILIERGVSPMAALVYCHRFLRFSEFDRHMTDLGNARRLVATHGHDLLYCTGLGWLEWDGRRWQRDLTGEVERRAKTIASTWAADADIVLGTLRFAVGDVEQKEIEERVVALSGWAKSCESAGKLSAMVEVASTEPSVPIAADEFDADPWLLNVQSGTIDLRTGKLRPHRREDLLRAICSVAYDPDAQLPEWDRFLDQVTLGDVDLQRYLQKLVGYSITGRATEELILALVGPAGSGKSTFVGAIKKTLGPDYVRTANFEMFLKKRSAGSGPTPELARLAGARIVISIEVDDGRELAQGLLKTVTGGDTITARHLYRDDFEFDPQFTLCLVVNDLPTTDADDSGMWRRLRALPFLHALLPEQRDPGVKALLTNLAIAGAAILAWAVRGCLMWQDEGLEVPEAVRQATDEHRSSVDALSVFIDECCDVGPELTVTSARLYGRYQSWAVENGEYPVLAQNAFGRKLKKKGFTPEKVDRHRGWRGLSVRHQSRWAKTPGLSINPPSLPPGPRDW